MADKRSDKQTDPYRITEDTTAADHRDYPGAEAIKAYRLRGRMMPLVGALTCLLFAVLVPFWYGVWATLDEPMALIGLGVIPMILAISCHLLGSSQRVLSVGWLKACLYGLGIGLNTAGTSLCMTAYYIHLHTEPTFSVLIAGALVSVAIYAILAGLIQLLPDRYGLLTGIAGLITLALIITSIVFWVRSDSKVFFSFGFFTLLWTLIAVIALHVACSDEGSPWLRFASFASFGILMAVAVIVPVILACAGGDCDCDCGDGCCDCGGCDCGGSGESRAAKKKKIK